MRKVILIPLIVLISSIKIHASHAAGMDISYECISQGANSDTYKITLKFYRDCDGIPAPSSLTLNYSSSCSSGSITLYQLGSAININPNCLSYCNGGNTLGIEQYTYESTINLLHCSNWMLSVCESARNATINTINNPGGQDLCVQATLNNSTYCNNSPTFSEYPTPFICAGNYYCYNNGAIETDGDSLSYSLVTPLNTATGGTINYTTPYSVTNPVGGGSSFDQTTGNLCVTPTNSITGVLAIKVSEYRNGILIGSITRDIQINAFLCTSINPPALTGINTVTIVDINDINTYSYELNCTDGSQNIMFNINTLNNNNPTITGSAVNMSWNNGIPGASFTVSNNNTINPTGTFIWTPTIADIIGSPYFFTVNVKNEACPAPGSFTFQYQILLNGPDINITPNISNPSCNGLNNGAINTIVTGGNIPYTYNWTNGPSTPNIYNLSAGTYSLTVTDSLGCTSNTTYSLINPPPFSPNINPTNISCYGANDGSIEVLNEPTSTTYLWSNSLTTSSINNLNPGSYSVNVTDTNGCVLTQFFNIYEPAEIIVTSSHNNISCYGANDGNINLSISGGSANYIVNLPPYSQSLANGISNYYSQPILSPGVYNYVIIDSDGCAVSDSIAITEPYQLTTNPIISDVLCKDEYTGSITLNTTGGTTPYIENIIGNNNAAQLSAGSYTYTVSDINGCSISDTFSLSEPDSLISNAISTDATCAGYFDGTASISIIGGTTPYNTNWNGSNPNGLDAGIHNYIITDDNGCTSQGSVTIHEPFGMQLIIDTFRVSCFGISDGSAILNISGGAGPPYNTYWGGVNPDSLPAGNHIITVSDVNNCYLTDTAFISQPDDIQITPLINNVSCFGDTNGSCQLQLIGGVPPYIQSWFGVNYSLLEPGNYPYQVTDNNNCIKNGSITINEPDLLKVDATVINVSCYGEENGEINIDVSGGTPPFITDFGVFNQYSLMAGTYPFTITDTNGCFFDSIAIVREANEMFLDFEATSPICRYEESTLSIHISNSISNNYEILLFDSIVQSFAIDTNGLLIPEGLPITITPNNSGEVYIISIKDQSNCIQEFNDSVYITVKQLPELHLNEDDICIGAPSYYLNKATPNGGIYFINNIMTDYFDVKNLDPDDYIIRYEYTDPNTSCKNEVSDIITISESPKAAMIISPENTDIDDPNILFTDNSNEHILISEWELGDGTIIYNEKSFWHTYTDTGTYTIKYYVENIYGCTDYITNNLTINSIYSIFIPDAFTPNNDGENDYFYPSIIGSNDYNMKIYNRWGELIYNEYNGKWDGTISNDFIQIGSYSYSISVSNLENETIEYTGTCTILR